MFVYCKPVKSLVVKYFEDVIMVIWATTFINNNLLHNKLLFNYIIKLRS